MQISVFELFSIGIGPSSSHTVGPMRAARAFVAELQMKAYLNQVTYLTIDLYGSLALTGMGHGTDKAVLLGLEGETPEGVDPATISTRMMQIHQLKKLTLLNQQNILFDPITDLRFNKKQFLEKHANALTFSAYDAKQNLVLADTYYSLGGGFIANELSFEAPSSDKATPPYPFVTASELFQLCEQHQLTVAQLMWANEKTWRDEAAIRAGLLKIAMVMAHSIEQGCHSTEKILPGGLKVPRRAAKLYEKLKAQPKSQHDIFNWVNLYALAVNEENAAGSRIVTAPTNGAAGIIPAVLQYHREFFHITDDEKTIDFLLTAAAIGILYKKGASISAAEVGCQGEIGVACSMAAGALTAVMGGTPGQVEKAAEMGMEHHLGLTCDPIGGLVQIPCIERNAMGAIQAINCAKLALMETDEHHVSLDTVIKTMLRTGKDMNSIYKETSLGGLALAVNVPAC